MKKTVILSAMLTVTLCISCSTESLEQIQENSANETTTTQEKRLRPTTPTIALANTGGCGTVVDTSAPSWANTDVTQYINSFSPLPPIKIEIKYHIVRTDDGQDGIPLSDLDIMTRQLNDDFTQPLYGCIAFNHSPSRIRFIHNGAVNYIDQTSFQIIDTNSSDTSIIAPEYDALIMEDNDITKINIYVIKGFNTFSNIQLYSKAAMNGNTVVVVRDQNAHKSPNLTHGVGHNLGLYHTYYRNNVCDLKTKNCDGNSGDFIEDTPIVSSLSKFNLNQNCEVQGRSGTDCNGKMIYVPDESVLFNSKNMMTTISSRAECRIGFTGMQHIRMNQMVIDLGLNSVAYSKGK